MLSPEEMRKVMEKAYVPEHVVPLMEGLSGGEAFLLGEFLFFVGEDWLIMVGFPLEESSSEEMERKLKLAEKRFRPSRLWFVGPQVPDFLDKACVERQRDQYFRLNLISPGDSPWSPPRRLKKLAAKAGEKFLVDCSGKYGSAHKEMTQEFLQNKDPGPKIREFYGRMPSYLERTQSALLLSAWDMLGRLAAYSVLELAAARFSVYVAGASRRQSWASYASDLLMAEMARISILEKKEFIHLGLGVNTGITRFKRKWGGTPWLDYRVCGWERSLSKIQRFVKSLGGMG